MVHKKRIIVVVPARNERRFIGETVRSVPAFVEQVVVVDDASEDDTGALAREAGGARVSVLRHSSRRGVGAAIATGYRFARASGADVVAVMAGDGQMDPADLEHVVAPIERGDVDYVKGNRLRHPGVLHAMPIPRLLGTMVFGWLTGRAAGIVGLGDAQCGYTAIDARAIDVLDLDTLWPGYGYPNDLLGRISALGLRVGEVVVRPVYEGQASGIRARHVAVILFLIGRVALRRGWVVASAWLAAFFRSASARPSLRSHSTSSGSSTHEG